MPDADETSIKETFELSDGRMLMGVHSNLECALPCPIHGPSDHYMKGWPQGWDPLARAMTRICTHGQEHIDPDSSSYRIVVDENGNEVPTTCEHLAYSCDGCCEPEELQIVL